MPEFCTSCGEAVQPGSGFCMKCGAKIEAQQAPTAQQQQAPQAQPYYAPQPQAQPAPQYQPPLPGKPQQAYQSDRTVALYDQDMPSPQPPPQGQATPPGSQVGFAPKRQAVYPQQQSVNAGYQPGPAPSAQPAAVPGYPPKAAAGMSMNDYLINLLIMSIPFVGLIISILWGLTPEQPDRSNLAKAMIVFNAIWMVLIGIMLIVFYNTLSSVADVKIEIGF